MNEVLYSQKLCRRESITDAVYISLLGVWQLHSFPKEDLLAGTMVSTIQREKVKYSKFYFNSETNINFHGNFVPLTTLLTSKLSRRIFFSTL